VTTFVDTSALYALLDAGDLSHVRAAQLFPELVARETLLTHNYVLMETTALVQRRLGMAAVATLLNNLIRPLDIIWIDEQIHGHAADALLAAQARKVSPVDWTSFEVMRRRGLNCSFAFDDDFTAQGFRTIP